jgi:hypothetical protein
MSEHGEILTHFLPDFDPGVGTLSRGAGEGQQSWIQRKAPLPHRGIEGTKRASAWWVRS